MSLLQRTLAKMKSYQCEECGFRDHRRFGRCPQCDGSNISTTFELPPNPTPLVALADVGRDPIPSIETGTIFDHITGHGCPLGRVILFYGPPGSGKSHQARKLLHALQNGIYFSYEERMEVVKEKFCELGGIDGLTRVFFSTVPFTGDLITLKEGVIIVDSLQLGMVEEETLAIGSSRMLIAITAEAMRIVRDHPHLIIVLIAHETKDAMVAGPRTVEHMVDVAMSIDVRLDGSAAAQDFADGKPWVPKVIHSVTIGKNRCGSSGSWDNIS